MEKAEIVDYLKGRSGGKLVMTPEQLEQEIGISTKQQSVLRTQTRFPIPHKKIGRSVYYSILHIADFLMDGEVYTAPNKKYEPKPPPPKTIRSKSNQDLSHLFLLGFFTANLEKQANQMLQLSQYLKSYANSKELHDDFQSKLEDKSTIISNVGKI